MNQLRLKPEAFRFRSMCGRKCTSARSAEASDRLGACTSGANGSHPADEASIRHSSRPRRSLRVASALRNAPSAAFLTRLGEKWPHREGQPSPFPRRASPTQVLCGSASCLWILYIRSVSDASAGHTQSLGVMRRLVHKGIRSRAASAVLGSTDTP